MSVYRAPGAPLAPAVLVGSGAPLAPRCGPMRLWFSALLAACASPADCPAVSACPAEVEVYRLCR